MDSLLTSLCRQQMEDLLSSVPDKAQLKLNSTLRYGQRIFAVNGNTVYIYRGDKFWECVLDGNVQV